MARDQALSAYEQAFLGASGRPPGVLDPEWLQRARLSAQAAHPDVHCEDERFAAGLGRRTLALDALDPARAADVWVVEAALAGDPAALNWFEKDALPQLIPALGKLRLDAAEREDTLQRLREELFVGRDGRRPKLNEYGGSGELRGWLRITLVRLGLKAIRGRRPMEDDAVLEQHAVDSDPELLLAKAEARELFRVAFSDALAKLAVKERLILKQHFVDGLTIDQLGTIHQVHRATAARHVQAARVQLVETLQRELMSAASISRGECDRVMAFVQSQLGATLKRRLGDL
jgi:RNA polymerase sigma-70 factor (ECF subfamily)